MFGGLDGILTSFAIVAGATGGNLSGKAILVLGLSNILADALAMGCGEFLSSKAHNDWVLSERSREAWEMANHPLGEIQEMIDIYENRGMSRHDATIVVEKMATYPDFFVDVMMAEELQLQLPSPDHRWESFKEGCIMFVSFATFGLLPILGYILIPLFVPSIPASSLFSCACVVTGISLFVLGSVKSIFSNGNWFLSGAETLLLGGACATIAFWVGLLVEKHA